MVVALILIFIVVPIIEIAVLIAVADVIGLWPTVVTLIVVSVLGAWLVKRQGVSLMRRLRETLDRGEIPTREGLDAILIFSAGVLCVVPGFVTDALGLLLLTPPARAFARGRITKRFAFLAAVPGLRRWRRASVVDVQWVGDVTPPRQSPSTIELGPGHG